MRFLCVSDQIDPLVYSPTLKDRYADVDGVLCAGDLPMDYIAFIVPTLSKPTFFVFGHHDLSEFRYYGRTAAVNQPNQETEMSHQHGGDYASNKVIRCRHLSFARQDGTKTPLLIAGVSGSIRYNNGQDQYTDREMFWQLIGLVPSLLFNKLKYGRYCDIFLTHASPRHIHDKEDPCHKGFECFNWFIRKFSPTLMVHGHIHLYDLQAKRVSVSGTTT